MQTANLCGITLQNVCSGFNKYMLFVNCFHKIIMLAFSLHSAIICRREVSVDRSLLVGACVRVLVVRHSIVACL